MLLLLLLLLLVYCWTIEPLNHIQSDLATTAHARQPACQLSNYLYERPQTLSKWFAQWQWATQPWAVLAGSGPWIDRPFRPASYGLRSIQWSWGEMQSCASLRCLQRSAMIAETACVMLNVRCSIYIDYRRRAVSHLSDVDVGNRSDLVSH